MTENTSGSPGDERSFAGSAEPETCEICFCRDAYYTYDIDGVETWGCHHCVWQWKMNGEGEWVPDIWQG